MVYMFLANGFEETEAICPLDILLRAGAKVKTVAVGTSGLYVTGRNGITVKADISEGELGSPDKSAVDMVILPGGMPGADNLYASQAVDNFVMHAAKTGAYIAAICAAPFILGRKGILRGRRATCYPGFEDDLIGATIVREGVVRDGNIITGEAMGSAIQFGLSLVSALCGEEKADEVASAILVK
jgi:4-methyl-5(b-hydroxyethyl)-thiazole monophosphate biosynthesis